MMLPKMKIGSVEVDVPIIQGGMGIGVSNYTLAGLVSLNGGLGVLSSAALDRVVSERHKKRFNSREASAQDVMDAKKISQGKPVGMNIMVATVKHYESSVLGAMDGGVDVIISGAGLPMSLVDHAKTHSRYDDVALVPIVSSGRVMELICKRWQRKGRLPDAVVVEGPKAGGHLAWRTCDEVRSPRNSLEVLVADVLEVAKKYGDISVIAAGGVYSHQDIVSYLNRGCVGVQMGTRFAVTKESGASQSYKEQVVQCTEADIDLTDRVGSPCGLLFRVLKSSPFYQEALDHKRRPNCNKGYLLNNGHCDAKFSNEKSFCICNGLLSTIGLENSEKELYTVGSLAYRIDQILSVCELMNELKGLEREVD